MATTLKDNFDIIFRSVEWNLIERLCDIMYRFPDVALVLND